MECVNNLEYYTTMNFVIYTCHLVYLGGYDGMGM